MARRPPQGIRIPTEWEPEIKDSMSKRGLKLHAWLRWAIRWALDSEKKPEVPVTLGNGDKHIGTAKVQMDEAGNLTADMNISGPVADAIAAGPFGEAVPSVEFVEPTKAKNSVEEKLIGGVDYALANPADPRKQKQSVVVPAKPLARKQVKTNFKPDKKGSK